MGSGPTRHRHLQKLEERGKANRTCNLALKKARRLYTREDVDQFCQAALVGSKNGAEFADYVRLLSLCGAREQETIKLQWADVNFEYKLLTIGADADTKNREARRVDFNAELETHLKAMQTRRAPDSQWLFPSPQRGDQDDRAKTFRESLLLTRAVPGWICLDCKKATFSKGDAQSLPAMPGCAVGSEGTGVAGAPATVRLPRLPAPLYQLRRDERN